MPVNDKTLRILGVRIDRLSMDDVTEWVRLKIRCGSTDAYLLVVNVAKLVKAREDSKLNLIIDNADLVGVDGMPLVWYSRLLPESLPEKVSGIDIMSRMFQTANREGWSFYFLGATEQVVQSVAARFQADYPGARLAGFRNGYFAENDEESVVSEIRKSGANILLIGFGSPRKENFVERWKGRLGVNVIHGVGGSFDVYAGVTQRAPAWMQASGLEWFFRLLQEPRRMFMRYAITNTKFLVLILRDRLGLLGPPVSPK